MNGLFKVKDKYGNDEHVVYAVKGTKEENLEFLMYDWRGWYFRSASNYEPTWE